MASLKKRAREFRFSKFMTELLTGKEADHLMVTFARVIASEERERAAKVCDSIGTAKQVGPGQLGAKECAAAIRRLEEL